MHVIIADLQSGTFYHQLGAESGKQAEHGELCRGCDVTDLHEEEWEEE